jgi:hypothetical protein
LTGTIQKPVFFLPQLSPPIRAAMLFYANSQPICVSAWYQRTYDARAARRRKPLQRKDLQLLWLFLVFVKDGG